MVPYHWISQRNYYSNIAVEFYDKNEEPPRHIKEQLRLIEAVIREYKRCWYKHIDGDNMVRIDQK